MDAVGMFDRFHDGVEIGISGKSQRGCAQDQDRNTKGFHFRSPLSALARGLEEGGLVFSRGIPNSPPRSANWSISSGPTMFTNVSSLGSAEMMTIPAIFSFSRRKKTSTFSPSCSLRTPTTRDHVGVRNWERRDSTSAAEYAFSSANS